MQRATRPQLTTLPLLRADSACLLLILATRERVQAGKMEPLCQAVALAPTAAVVSLMCDVSLLL